MTTNNNPPPSNHYTADDEIDLFELAELLWSKKTIIILIVLAFSIAGLVYVYIAPVKPDYYEGRALVEVGSYMSQQDLVEQLLNVSDLTMILKKEVGVNASIPRGTDSLVEITATAPDRDTAASLLENAFAFISQRESFVVDKLGEAVIIESMRVIGNSAIDLKSKKDNVLLIVTLSTLIGLMVGIVMVLFFNAISVRRQKQTDEHQV